MSLSLFFYNIVEFLCDNFIIVVVVLFVKDILYAVRLSWHCYLFRCLFIQ